MHPIVLYDGVCGLCNRFVQFILRRDHKDRFLFAALQSTFAREILQRHGLNPDSLETVYVVFDRGQPAERLLSRTEAAVTVLKELGGACRIWAILLQVFPNRIRDWQYDLIARNRYRLLGKHASCPLPDPTVRHKFLDLS